VLIE
jgi:hypothetical protein